MLVLYDYRPSQNAYKIRLLLSHLERPYEQQEVSIFEGEGQSEAYLSANPMGAVPAIRLEDGRYLAESNAILTYLAEGTPYLPGDPVARAKVMQWLFFESDYIQNGVAALRYWTMTGKVAARPPELIAQKRDLSLRTLTVLDRELAGRPYLAGEDYTIADISVFAYVHRAYEAGIPLTGYPHIVAWTERIVAQPRFLGKVYPYAIDPHSSGEL